MDEAVIREGLIRHWRYEGIDYDKSHEIYDDDAVLEFPQSGERFVGKENFLTWRRKYPAKLDFRIRRISHDGDLWVTENLLSYDGGPWMFTLNVLQFRDERIAHERLYVMEGFDAAPWRAEWAELFDPLEAITPGDWRDGGEQ
ncbi:MAG: nuclear transport factor 2 family protein [Chloroflexi bacterium]|nr:nuclear transport factor 2 family protein [Chloroflexota bacterium]